jgi:branched-chain amino acid transport system permease protein
MGLSNILQYLFSGLTYGSIYAVVALGFNIVYNSTGIINFAQGEFVMLGGMLTYAMSSALPLPLAILAAVTLTAAIGSLIELVFVRSLEKPGLAQLAPIIGGLAFVATRIAMPEAAHKGLVANLIPAAAALAAIGAFSALYILSPGARAFLGKERKSNAMQMTIMTIGISILIRETALEAWGEQVKTVPYFTGTEVSSLSLLGAGFSPQMLWIAGATALVVTGLSLFFRFTLTGQAMRGCAASKDGARLCGINARLMVNLSFTLAAAIGAVAGSVTAPLTQTHYALGTSLAIKGFTVAVFGGLGGSAGAVAAGFILGIMESFLIIVIPEAYKDIATILILLLVLLLRPAGLFGSREAGRLAEH